MFTGIDLAAVNEAPCKFLCSFFFISFFSFLEGVGGGVACWAK